MLESVKISRRQSEIRQQLATLVAKEKPTEDETRSMETLDGEYRGNETRYRAALIAEDTERREAKDDLETRGDREYAELVDKFEVRQIALHFDEGRALSGPTLEVVQEMREHGSYRGLPIPLTALEKRTGETIASGVPDPIRTMPIIDRIFPASCMQKMGGALVNIDSGQQEYPVVNSSVTAGWQTSETGAVAAATAFSTVDRSLSPDNTMGVQMKVTRKAMKQSGPGLEAAIRRDMSGAIQAELDRAAFQGLGSSGEPLGIVSGAVSYGITHTDIAAGATWGAFRACIVRFMLASAAGSPSAVKLLIRPETFDDLDGTIFDSGSGLTEWDRLLKNVPIGNIAMSPNALGPDIVSPAGVSALLTTNAGGVPPFYLGIWGGVDVIKDIYSDAASGGLRLTGLITADICITRAEQCQVLRELT